jgi:double-stranded uracil-DNA glycosylase
MGFASLHLSYRQRTRVGLELRPERQRRESAIRPDGSGIEEGARALEKLPDQLEDHLRLVFVGTAAGQRSADLGHYYAGPGNRFWRTIHEVGITPRRYEPHEFSALLKLGIGFTDLCKFGAGMDHQALAFPVDIPAFREKIRRYQPQTIAFTSKRAASLFYGRPTKAVALGRQPPQDNFPVVFVLASPSGAASGHWSVQPWQELADSIDAQRQCSVQDGLSS